MPGAGRYTSIRSAMLAVMATKHFLEVITTDAPGEYGNQLS